MAEARLSETISLLIERGHLDPGALAYVAPEQVNIGDTAEIALNRSGALKDDDLAHAYSTISGHARSHVPSILPDIKGLPVNLHYLQKRYILPLELGVNVVTLGMVNPTDHAAIGAMAFALQKQIEPVTITMGDWSRAVAKHLNAEASENGSKPTTATQSTTEILRASALDAPIARKVSSWFAEAIDQGSSDLHIEPTKAGLQIKYRIDGHLSDVHLETGADVEPIIARLKVMADLDLGERRLPQDGRTTIAVRGRPVDIRVSIIPTVNGESAVLRLLDKSSLELDLDKLGFSPFIADWLRSSITKPNGLYIVSGPTGSGKTTTLYAALEGLKGSGRKILSAEDPVEYHFEHVSQSQINADIDFDFPTVLRSFLRQDPDVIMIGETRDAETAQIAVQAALTGHLVLATLHAIDAKRVIARLIDLGVEPFQLASAFRGALAQRLVRLLCGHCKQPRQLSDEERLLLVDDSDVKTSPMVYQAQGCEKCDGKGYKGRRVVAEAFSANEFIRDCIKQRDEAAMQKELDTVMPQTLKSSLTGLVIEGLITPEDAISLLVG